MECVFCRIAGGELPCRTIYEDGETKVFLDIAGDVDGHMIAIPKKHVESLLDCDEETLAHRMQTVQRVAKHCVARCGCAGVNLLNASGVCAGQSVPHLHIHIIPRKPEDGIDAWPTFEGAGQDPDLVYEQFRMERP